MKMSGKAFLSSMLASGGDCRIIVPSGQNTNRYGASPHPRATLGYASSTANDISLGAFAHLEAFLADVPAGGLGDHAWYVNALEQQRRQCLDSWGQDQMTDMIFAPSGTDLELVALAITHAHSGQQVTNVLLGQDEVGSGCVLAAAGRFFADDTVLSPKVEKGSEVDGLGGTQLQNISIRDADGNAKNSAEITASILEIGRKYILSGRHLLVHVVHGSKTGLVLPNFADIDQILASLGAGVTVVVDACQARTEGSTIRAYLDRGAMVMLSGSKFIGGPPFSGMLLVPPNLRPNSGLAAGLSKLLRRAEFPLHWKCANHLPNSANPGLLLRLEAANFELNRYTLLPEHIRSNIISAFGRSVHELSARLETNLVQPALASNALHEATLATLDLSNFNGRTDFMTSQRWWRVLAARGLKLGQPVKCRKLDNDEWAGTLRISLSMPLIVELSALSTDQLRKRLQSDMTRIADVLEAASRPVVA